MTVQKGHIKLGAPGALRDYLLTDPKQFSSTPANPMAAKIATGAGKLDDFTNWSFWVMEDWSAGAGRRADDVGNGYMFGDCASFMRNRLTLPLFNAFITKQPQSYAGSSAFNIPFGVDGLLPVGSTQTYGAAALKVASFGDTEAAGAWFYVYVDGVCTSATIRFSRNSVGLGHPSVSAPLYTAAIDLTGLHPGGQWIYLDFGEVYEMESWLLEYWVWVLPTVYGETLYIPTSVYDADKNQNTPVVFDNAWGAGWTASPNTFFAIINSTLDGLADGGATGREIVDIVSTGVKVYAYGETGPFVYTAGDDAWDDVFTAMTYAGPDVAYDMHVWGDVVYVAHGTKLYKIAAGGAASEVGVNLAAHVLASWNGYLYRASGNKLWYSGDGATWEGPFEVGPAGVNVTGLAGLGEYLYIATEDGLYYLAPGDFVVGIAPFPALDAANGARMINHNGALYIPMRNRIWQFTASGSFVDVWIDQGADFPSEYLGEIHSLATSHLGLIASVRANDQATSPTLWVQTSEGWHCLAALPPDMGAGRVVADAANRRLWCCTWQGMVYWLPFEPMAVIPTRNPQQRWAPYGWMETDWYSGGLLDVEKDWESVTIFGENLSAGQKVSVYYRDGEEAAWRLLGAATADNTELRWNQSVYRPTSVKIKLGFLLSTNDIYTTPEVRAIRVKYHPMVADRWRWQFSLPVHTNQQMLDGTLNSYTAAQQLAHLDGLVTQVKPVIFQEIGGVQYEVKVLGASRQVVDFEARPDGTRELKWVYTLSLEQVTGGVFV